MIKLERNESCWCRSGKKFKRCHLGFDPKNTIIIFGGIPGAGKTTLRKAFADLLPNEGFFELDWDSYVSKQIGQNTAVTRAEIEKVVQRTLIHMIEWAKRGPLIADSLTSPARLFGFKKHYASTGGKMLAINLTCEELTRRARTHERKLLDYNAIDGENAHGFPQKSEHEVWDLHLDSTNTSSKNLALQVFSHARKTIWNTP